MSNRTLICQKSAASGCDTSGGDRQDIVSTIEEFRLFLPCLESSIRQQCEQPNRRWLFACFSGLHLTYRQRTQQHLFYWHPCRDPLLQCECSLKAADDSGSGKVPTIFSNHSLASKMTCGIPEICWLLKFYVAKCRSKEERWLNIKHVGLVKVRDVPSGVISEKSESADHQMRTSNIVTSKGQVASCRLPTSTLATKLIS